ncbi:TIGR03086 family metal-binding protein [Actinoplanes sp. CA-030573]|uniref:TIGR03086 family metal-binding protein n=1 Tax=Actinoplanes sp. CA-030573 TaxID=3239898 RepID=UPI003D8ECE83
MSIISLDALAVKETVRLVAQLTPADLSRPTPCAEWDLAALLTHMTVQNRGFALAAAGLAADWSTPRIPDPVRSYLASCDQVIDAFADPDVLNREFELPEISTVRTFPGSLAIGFHLVDYVVHGWDVATAAGLPFEPSPEVLEATLPLARAVPPGSPAFAPALPVPPGADTLTEILLRLGRKVSGGAATKDA